jgi:SAM-dependent methyltransferase
MTRKKTSLGTTTRRPIALRTAAALASAGTSPRRLVARHDVQEVAGTAGSTTGTVLRQPATIPPQDNTETRRADVEAALLQLVSPHTRVLIIGRETWPLSRSLSSAGCRVWVIETRHDAPGGSATFSDRLIVGDPETLDLAAALDGVQFDCIVAVQLLEHVRNPVRVLTTLRRHLTADGSVVAAVPNILHGSIRLGFLTGKPPAALLAPEAGSPPSHWYDAAALHRTFERAQLVITRIERHTEAFDDGHAPRDGMAVPSQLADALKHDADATTRTFVVAAHPFPLTGRVLLDMRVRELAQAHERALQQVKQLAERGDGLDARYIELKCAVDGAIGTMGRIGADVQHVNARDSRLESSLAGAHQRLMTERTELAPISRELKRFQYEQLIVRVRVLVDATVPKGVLALVVSKGDDRLIAFQGRRAWHFLRNDQGVYAGHHPADSASAIAALKRCRAAGATYLVIPQMAFWWLDHYAAFREHLDRCGRVVARDDRTAVIYALAKAERRQ